MTQPQLIARIEALEREVAKLRRESRPKRNWREFVGMFAGDEDFKKAAALGAAYRRAQRPKNTSKAAYRR